MSIIGVRVPKSWVSKTVMKVIGKASETRITFLSFKDSNPKSLLKTAFIRLSEKDDPQLILERLEQKTLRECGKVKAFICEEMPDIHYMPAHKSNLYRKPFNPALKSIKKSIIAAHRELMIELQSKYNRLFKLSRMKTEHKLLMDLSETIFKRLKAVTSKSGFLKPFPLTSMYRKSHPHASDLRLIYTALNKILDRQGTPRVRIEESDLIDNSPTTLTFDNIPYKKVIEACKKYTERITKKVQEHIDGLPCEPSDDVDANKLTVRKHLKKLLPYLPTIIRQVMSKHLIPFNTSTRKVRIYGDPYLPGQDVMRKVLDPYHPINVQRIQEMYNLLRFKVTTDRFPALMKLDGTETENGCRLVVRSGDEKLFITPEDVMAELVASV